MRKKVNEVFNDVAVAEGIEPKKIKDLFVWYDLLSCALSFQLLFILAYSIGINYATTMLCAIAIITMDMSLKVALEKNTKNFEKLQKQIPLVKLWTIPLMVMGIATSAVLVIATLGLIK